MTTSKGPFNYDAESGEITTKDRTGFWGPDHEPVVVATVEPLDGVDNGPLLAASAELLEALKSLIREHDSVFAGREDGAQDSYYNAHPGRAIAYQKARAAVAKAEGQS